MATNPAAAAATKVKTEGAVPQQQKQQPPTRPTVEDHDFDTSEDDLDELDDFLDEFNIGKPPPPSSAPGKAAGGEPAIDEDWARMLQAGMADLLSEANQSPGMQDEFERLAKELQDAITAPTAAAAGPSTAPPAATATAPNTKAKDPVNFQERIKATMERMQSSNAEVDAGLAETDSEDFLAEMLKSMGGVGDGGDEDFSSMLVNMMEQLTSKEILYEPMKELNEKYPEWIHKNEAKESKEDMARYREQYHIVKEIVAKFEEPGYKDDNEACREYIVERMQKMQNAGAPPSELMGDMGQGIDPMADVPSDCGVQ